MLSYLLDENISFVVAEQLARKNPSIGVQSVYHWRNGAFVGQEDGHLLRAATLEGLTLVTYDLSTIPPLLAEMAAEGEAHAGVLFVDDASIRSNDFGGLVMALLAHWQRYGAEAWNNRVGFLEPSGTRKI
ncbi:MAG: hypothetical protein JWL77_2784 [Chthonomonadaceae bacterium]|nr:hypothetical protein [Chthonomonadaceae bacterium]